MRFSVSLLAAALVAGLCHAAFAAGGPAYTDPKDADADFPIQGEYAGDNLGVQVIALGKGKFRAVVHPGGLPGAGWNEKDKSQVEGETAGDATSFKSDDGALTIKDGVLTMTNSGGDKVAELKKVLRKSPTLGAKPPKGALVLFDGASVENFPGAKMTEDGLLMQGVKSKQTFQSYFAHIEFLLPYMPQARGQGRANSGYYVQGRYELQMLDSFGLSGENNECGGFYTLAKPRVNMCYPPLSWQTYDVDFTAAEWEGDKKVKNARVTVKHNGVVIHDDYELPKETPGGVSKEIPGPGPITLQNHGDPVRYRNIWVVPAKAEQVDKP